MFNKLLKTTKENLKSVVKLKHTIIERKCKEKTLF